MHSASRTIFCGLMLYFCSRRLQPVQLVCRHLGLLWCWCFCSSTQQTMQTAVAAAQPLKLTVTARSKRKVRSVRLRPVYAVADAVAAEQDTRATDKHIAKDELLSWITGTKRGSSTTKLLRGQIEEAQVSVEALSPAELDYSLLEGKWLLQYTDALDVTPIVGLDLPDFAGLPPPVRVGNVYQRFSSVELGIVENIIEFTIPLLLEDRKGCTFTVEASYDVASPRRIRLIFNQAEVGQVHINSGLETLIAPALLPRGSLNQQILLALKEFKLSFPFRSAQQVVQGSGAGASYLLTYLDEDMLIGRGPQGTFIFSRVADDAVAAAAADTERLTL